MASNEGTLSVSQKLSDEEKFLLINYYKERQAWSSEISFGSGEEKVAMKEDLVKLFDLP